MRTKKIDLFDGFCSEKIAKIITQSMIEAGMNDEQQIKELPTQIRRLRKALRAAITKASSVPKASKSSTNHSINKNKIL